MSLYDAAVIFQLTSSRPVGHQIPRQREEKKKEKRFILVSVGQAVFVLHCGSEQNFCISTSLSSKPQPLSFNLMQGWRKESAFAACQHEAQRYIELKCMF